MGIGDLPGQARPGRGELRAARRRQAQRGELEAREPTGRRREARHAVQGLRPWGGPGKATVHLRAHGAHARLLPGPGPGASPAPAGALTPFPRDRLPDGRPDTHTSGGSRRLGPNSSTCPPAGTHTRRGHTPPSRPCGRPGLTLRFPLVRCLFFPPMVAVAAALSVRGAELDTAGPQLPVPRAGRGLIVATSPRPPEPFDCLLPLPPPCQDSDHSLPETSQREPRLREWRHG